MELIRVPDHSYWGVVFIIYSLVTSVSNKARPSLQTTGLLVHPIIRISIAWQVLSTATGSSSFITVCRQYPLQLNSAISGPIINRKKQMNSLQRTRLRGARQTLWNTWLQDQVACPLGNFLSNNPIEISFSYFATSSRRLMWELTIYHRFGCISEFECLNSKSCFWLFRSAKFTPAGRVCFVFSFPVATASCIPCKLWNILRTCCCRNYCQSNTCTRPP